MNIKEILDESNTSLFRKPNVIATGIGYKQVNGEKTGSICIICSVIEKVAKKRLTRNQLIPSDICGVKTDVLETGAVKSLDLSSGRFRPAPGGVSIGHQEVTSGTLGCLVRRGTKSYILSNNHVIANLNLASPGDPVLQPGPSDGGRFPEDQISILSDYVPIFFDPPRNILGDSGLLQRGWDLIKRVFGLKKTLAGHKHENPLNLADCAIAGPVYDHEVIGRIRGIGYPAGTVRGTLGMEVVKSGRTTGITRGRIEQTNVTIRIYFGDNKTALFHDQLITSPMSMGGDSGSAVLNLNNSIVGLIFAGSKNISVLNRIDNVFSLLDLTT